MSGFENTVFGPLRKPYCNYFYFLSVLGYVFMIGSLISLLYVGATTKKTEPKFYMAGFMVVFAYGIIYFQNRLLYSMCVGSLKEGYKPPPRDVDWATYREKKDNDKSKYSKTLVPTV